MDIMGNFEEYLLCNIPEVDSFHPNYNDALAKMIKAGGKRFRPKLLLSVVEALEPRLLKNSFPVAMAIEYLHTYSLIHDDLPAMDNADLRRGNTTLHVDYDETTAILAGDGLNTHAFFLLSNAPLNQESIVSLVRSLSYDGGIYGMVLGQAIDCHFENKKLNLDELRFLHNHKTGVLIAASLKMGAIIAQVGKQVEDDLYEFGVKLGLLFQIEDDIIDVTQSKEDAGKTTNNDEEKNSFVNLLGLDGAIEYKKELLNKLKKEARDKFPASLSKSLISLMEKYF